ncbi:glycosyltransferase [Streptomyces sp. CBMA29]|uniref:glycosyltransferase n=1 Tax=Streptomyces sp. CBMA29 TaxID=1896314 RepID=UPI001661BD09|nr:glycosyltransferase [Streptomyces sp. CBMA29]MBD0738960.1 UDP-glucuronosyl/UDP-glucosyltransferase [Streptomyces sp. CBMA29]
MARIVVVSPPFQSHARPLSVLAGALRRAGDEVHFACAPAFEELARDADIGFVPLTVTRNANTGIAERTEQDTAEAARLTEFLDATRAGAVPALLAQARHRRADMLADPERILADLRNLQDRLRPDWYLVDQLNYPVTLALHCLGLSYASYCPGHPGYLPSGPDAFFGEPSAWPAAIRPRPAERAALRTAVRANDAAFTSLFADFAALHAPHRPPPGRAFALTSPHAVVYCYPPLGGLPVPPEGREALYAGHCAAPDAPVLDPYWRGEADRLRATAGKVVLVAFGTFLSARDDVLRTVARGVLERCPDATVVLAAGDRTAALADLAGPRVCVAASVPQRALLAEVDAMVHHGGNNSFTECLAAGVPALVLPFSSDQFAVAHDAERAGAAVVLDPAAVTGRQIGDAVAGLLTAPPPGLGQLSARVRERGPDWAAARLRAVMAAGQERPVAP